MIIQERIEAVGNASYLHSRVSPSTYAYGYFFIPTMKCGRLFTVLSANKKSCPRNPHPAWNIKNIRVSESNPAEGISPYAAVRPLVNSITAFATTVR